MYKHEDKVWKTERPTFKMNPEAEPFVPGAAAANDSGYRGIVGGRE